MNRRISPGLCRARYFPGRPSVPPPCCGSQAPQGGANPKGRRPLGTLPGAQGSIPPPSPARAGEAGPWPATALPGPGGPFDCFPLASSASRLPLANLDDDELPGELLPSEPPHPAVTEAAHSTRRTVPGPLAPRGSPGGRVRRDPMGPLREKGGAGGHALGKACTTPTPLRAVTSSTPKP